MTVDGGRSRSDGRPTTSSLTIRVSRHHGRLIAARARWSTAIWPARTARVNGVEIDEVVLGAGDRIELGDTVLVVESVGDA